MAEDIKEDENIEEASAIEEENSSSDGIILEDNDETQNEEESEQEPTTEDENTEDNDSNEESESQDEEKEETTVNEELPEDDSEDHSVQQKQSKLQKILIIVIGVLTGVLVLGFILYLFGVFDPEPPKPQPVEETAIADPNLVKKPEKYIFDPNDINIDRINGKLRILTKYEIIGTEAEERQKELEKNSKLSTAEINKLIKAEEEAKKKAEEEKIRLAEEAKKKAEEEKKRLEEEAKRKAEEEKVKAENPYDLLKFIQVSINEESLLNLKPEFEKLGIVVSKCSDNSQSFLLIGPFKSNKDLNSIFKTIYSDITQSATKKDLARLEFNRVCK